MEQKQKFREESDLIGKKNVPSDALYGINALRAIENFKISGKLMSEYPNLIKGFAIIKKSAAQANNDLGILTKEKKDAIIKACDELYEGKHSEQFPIDMIQGGAGTSCNMCANEVIANRALQLLGKEFGDYHFCSPHDDVNRSQSTNDVYPSACKLGIYFENQYLEKTLEKLIESLDKKKEEFKNVIKIGRTQMQDAVPMTLGQTFGAYSSSIKDGLYNIREVSKQLLTVNMGATAIGTGICSEPGYCEKIIEYMKKNTGLEIKLSEDLIYATSDTSGLVNYSSSLKNLSLKLIKICNDLRLLSSGPRCGIGEIMLPKAQPGSSIMPGKVNPVIPEVVQQVCYKVIGNDTTVMLGSENAQLELNAFEPVMVYSIFESIELFINGINTLIERCINGVEVDEKRCHSLMQHSTTIVTAFNPYIGYKASTELSKECLERDMGIYDLILEKKILTKEQVDLILKPENLIKPIKLNIETVKKEEKK
jgi:aspartate ammonia-lyase